MMMLVLLTRFEKEPRYTHVPAVRDVLQFNHLTQICDVVCHVRIHAQSYIQARGIFVVASGILIIAMTIIGCVGTHRQVQRDRE